MASVTLSQLSVDLNRRSVLDGISLVVPDGEFAAVVGPSGVGKSSLLRAVAGLTEPSGGTIAFDGRNVTKVGAAARDIGMVFQTPALLPHRNVRRNVEFPLELRRQAADEIHERVGAEARAMRIEHILRRQPSSLSRGEQQLVQIARTMVRAPHVLLLDEPFAPLDEQLRSVMRSEIRTLQRGYGVTTIMASNDPVDAMSLASIIFVLDGPPGRIVQYGTPRELHDEPATLAVAAATGPLWTVEVGVTAEGGGFWLAADGAVRLRSWSSGLRDHVGRTLTLGVRSADLIRSERGEATAVLRRVIPGAESGLLCSWGGRMVTATGTASEGDIGSTVRLRVQRSVVFDTDGRRIA